MCDLPYARPGETIVMVGALDGLPLPDGPVETAEAPDEARFEASESGAVRGGERMAERRLSPSLLLLPAARVSVWLEARVASVAQVAADETVAVLSGVATLPAARGRGLARRACLAAFGWARSEGARIAWLRSRRTTTPRCPSTAGWASATRAATPTGCAVEQGGVGG